MKLGALALGQVVQNMVLICLDSPLKLQQTLRTARHCGQECYTLSCIYAPRDLSAAWRYVHGFRFAEEEFILEGVTQIAAAVEFRALRV